MKYSLQLQTEEWKIKRFSILQRDGFKCKKCGSKEKLHVHHKVYEKGLMAWEAENRNLITLCSKCHEAIHSGRHISTFFKQKNKSKKMTKQQKNDARIRREMKKSREEQYKNTNFKR